MGLYLNVYGSPATNLREISGTYVCYVKVDLVDTWDRFPSDNLLFLFHT